MYKSVKLFVSVNGTLSNNLSCTTGVRQRDNLSLLFFSIFLKDLKLFFRTSPRRTEDCELSSCELSVENLHQNV